MVDQATKEVGRLRNARVTGCGICKNLRFEGAVADALIDDPSRVASMRPELDAEFAADELVELVATITTAIAFSKAAVAFGAPPEMPLMVVPTPSVSGTVG